MGFTFELKRPRDHGIVGLAAIIEIRHEQIAQIFQLLGAAGGPVIEIFRTALRLGDPLDDFIGFALHSVIAVLVDEFAHECAVQTLRVEIVDRFGVALLPMADDVGENAAGPMHAALEESEIQIGESAGDAAEE